jgi:hypothetical protein
MKGLSLASKGGGLAAEDMASPRHEKCLRCRAADCSRFGNYAQLGS